MTAMRIVVSLALGVAAACGSSATAASVTVAATLTDNKILLDQATAPSGEVTFAIKNGGTVVHSLVLLKTDVPHDKLPLDPADASRVQQTGVLKETGQIAAGQTKQFTAKLAPGSYVLVCNEPAHYQLGMHIGFTVK